MGSCGFSLKGHESNNHSPDQEELIEIKIVLPGSSALLKKAFTRGTFARQR
jgi:hypothetical protein